MVANRIEKYLKKILGRGQKGFLKHTNNLGILANKKFASKVLVMFPPWVKIGLFNIGTFRKFSSLLEKDTRNSEKLLDILQSVSPRLLLSSVFIL